MAGGLFGRPLVFNEKCGIDKEMLQKALLKKNIDARVFFWPLSMLPMSQNKSENKNSFSIYKRAINLPSFHDINDDEQDRVVQTIFDLIESCI